MLDGRQPQESLKRTEPETMISSDETNPLPPFRNRTQFLPLVTVTVIGLCAALNPNDQATCVF
jgi:hypothetical protein